MSIENGCPNPDCNDPECKAGDLFKELTGDREGGFPSFDKFMKMLQESKKEKSRVHVDFMNDSEITRYNELRALGKQIADDTAKLNTLRKSFWADIEIRLNNFTDDLHINTELQSIEKDAQ